MLILTVILMISTFIMLKVVEEYDGLLFAVSIGVASTLIINVAMVGFIIFGYIDGYTIVDKIKMYQEENKNIESQITTIANNYQGYEKEMISNVADMETVLIKIPDLKSSELVNTQMEIYVNNNNKIKELKEKQIDMKIYKWLLYFGK